MLVRQVLYSDMASMRPPEFTGGNFSGTKTKITIPKLASMRPPEFTGGNGGADLLAQRDVIQASMRPPEFTGGNPRPKRLHGTQSPRGFNEAAGIHRRKQRRHARLHAERIHASMRPPEFTGGNNNPKITGQDGKKSFNEAAGIHRRKQQPENYGSRWEEKLQ